MPDSADRKKYEPLGEFLDALPTSDRERTLSFDQVEQIIGDTLPPSATAHREWWSNQEGGSRAPHWRAAGFKVDKVDLARKIVRFKRIGQVNESPRALTLLQVVTVVNERSLGRPFGGLPEWRKEHKGKKTLPGVPFYSGLDEGRDYVFHIGGLSELQFNLAFEDVGGVNTFRHGVAFSLQTTRELPTIDPLTPKVEKFNEYLSLYPDAFMDFEMWNFTDGVRSEKYPCAARPGQSPLASGYRPCFQTRSADGFREDVAGRKGPLRWVAEDAKRLKSGRNRPTFKLSQDRIFTKLTRELTRERLKNWRQTAQSNLETVEDL